jgi:hypothetical protein
MRLLSAKTGRSSNEVAAFWRNIQGSFVVDTNTGVILDKAGHHQWAVVQRGPTDNDFVAVPNDWGLKWPLDLGPVD